MDEQECIKMDVALACFVRSAVRGLIASDAELQRHELLVADFNAVITDGLNARVQSPNGKTARDVCKYYLRLAEENADVEERKYLGLVQRRIEEGNLSNLIRERVERRAERTVLREAIVDVYSKLINCLCVNEPF
jgi:hypothetical protein